MTATPKRETHLAAQDWVDAAAQVLAEDGEQGVQVSALCRRLGVTKGSFYWHFASRRALLDAVLEAWRIGGTLKIVHRIVSLAADPLKAVRTLLALPRKSLSPSGFRVEMSIRDWARRDSRTAQAVAGVDAVRLRSFEQLFAAHGLPSDGARAHAYLAYCLMMGDAVLKDTLRHEVDTETFLAEAMALLAGKGRSVTVRRRDS